MPTTPISGQHGKIAYGTTPTILGVTKWSAKPTANSLDVSNTVDGRRRIAGLGDAEGSFDVHVDTAATMEADLAVGTIVELTLYTTTGKAYQGIQAIIDDIDYGVEVEGSYDATVSWKLASGTFPAAPTDVTP